MSSRDRVVTLALETQISGEAICFFQMHSDHIVTREFYGTFCFCFLLATCWQEIEAMYPAQLPGAHVVTVHLKEAKCFQQHGFVKLTFSNVLFCLSAELRHARPSLARLDSEFLTVAEDCAGLGTAWACIRESKTLHIICSWCCL